MCNLRGIIWYIIHANRMLLKNWPHLTFGWPFVNISLTIHPTHSKLYIFVIPMTSRVIWYTWKVIWSISKFWPPLDPCVTPTGKGPNRPKFCQNIFRPITTSKLSITHFRQNGTWVLLPLHLQLFSFLKIKFQNAAHLKKGLFLTYFSHFLVTREKLQKFLLHISPSHTYMYFAHPIDFFALPILKWIRIYQVLFLFGVILGVNSYSRHFGTINK